MNAFVWLDNKEINVPNATLTGAAHGAGGR